MANMTFGVNILPSTNNALNLGNSSNKWVIYAQDASSSMAGLMPSTDKTKLDSMEIATDYEVEAYFAPQEEEEEEVDVPTPTF